MIDMLETKVRRRQRRASKRVQRFGRRREAKPRLFCLRAELLPQGRSAFLPQLETVKPNLELYFHPVMNRWLVYSLAAKGSSPASDFLVMEYELKGAAGEYRPPGTWLVDELRKRSLTANGAKDPIRARDEYLDNFDEIERQNRRDYDRPIKDWRREAAKAVSLGFLGHHSERVGEDKLMVRTKPGRKVVWGKQGERLRY